MSPLVSCSSRKIVLARRTVIFPPRWLQASPRFLRPSRDRVHYDTGVRSCRSGGAGETVALTARVGWLRWWSRRGRVRWPWPRTVLDRLCGSAARSPAASSGKAATPKLAVSEQWPLLSVAGDRQAQFLCDASRGFTVGVGKQHEEFLTAVARGEVASAQRRGEDLPDRGERPVALVVAVDVVDLLEVVEVEEYGGQGADRRLACAVIRLRVSSARADLAQLATRGSERWR